MAFQKVYLDYNVCIDQKDVCFEKKHETWKTHDFFGLKIKNDHFDPVLSYTSSQEGQFFLNGSSRCPWLNQICHTKWPCLVKLDILI